MEEAIGSKISDYLIKPVNPMQILLSVKKNLETSRLVSEKATSNYQQEFREIGMMLNDNLDKKVINNFANTRLLLLSPPFLFLFR